MKHLFLIFTLISLSSLAQTDSFRYSSYNSNGASHSLDLYDLNMDGNEDLILSVIGGGVDILLNDSIQNYRLVLELNKLEEHLAIGDLNFDGSSELIGTIEGVLGYYSIQSDLVVSEFRPICAKGEDHIRVELVDIDLDSDLDLILTRQKIIKYGWRKVPDWRDEPEYAFIENLSEAGFGEPISIIGKSKNADGYLLFDYNSNDKKEFVLVEMSPDSTTSILVAYEYLNQSFTRADTIVKNLPQFSYNLSMLNLDQDLPAEILFCHGRFLSLLDYNSTIGEYETIDIPHPFAAQQDVDWWDGIDRIIFGDQNKDGFQDLFIVGGDYKTGVMWNDGYGRFPDYIQLKDHPFDEINGFEFITIDSAPTLGTLISSNDEVMFRCLSLQCLNKEWEYVTEKN